MRYKVEFEMDTPCDSFEISEWAWRSILLNVEEGGDRIDWNTFAVYKQLGWEQIDVNV